MEVLLKNNTGNQGKDTLVSGFVVRLKPFNNIFNELKLSKGNKPEQNYLIIGQRGAGKTTLLFRLKYAIEDDDELNGTILPIIFHEEQYRLTELSNLWEAVAEQLEEAEGFEGLSERVALQITGGKYDEEKAYDLLEESLRHHGKKVILFIENIDVLFKKFGKDGQQRLREVLSTSHSIRIIGSSTTYFEGIMSYTEPFYDFFKIVQLHGLSSRETYKLLIKIAQQSGELEKVELLLRRSNTRVEALRRLTGGNPRMMAYLYQIFLDNASGKVIKDLYRLLDDLTFLYKSELDQLSAQQQKMVDVIARNWDAISAKEISSATRMESKHVSSVLNMLEKNQVIERINTRTKNNLYRLRDRFLNIWYLMRFGKKKDREDILWLVRFYDAWCDRSELSERVSHYINNLLGGEYDNVAAVDMVNTFLSCKNVSALDKYKLFQTTKSTLPTKLIKDLKLKKEVWFATIRDLVKKSRFAQAIKVLEEMGDNGISYHSFAYWIYLRKKDFDKAAEHLEWLYNEKLDALTALTLADLYETKLSESSKAVHYFKIALAGGEYKAAFRLAQIYQFVDENKLKAIEYYKIAVGHEVEEAVMALATLYFMDGDYEGAKKLCLRAIEKGDAHALVNMSILLQREGDTDGAIEVLKKAIDAGNDYALIKLGEVYLNMTKGNESRAKELYELAVQKGVPEAHYALGKFLLRNEKNVVEAENILKLGIEHEDEDAAHLLAHLYQEQKDFGKAEEMYLKSFDMGHASSLLCLANGAFRNRLNDRRAYILELFESRLAPFDEPITLVEYVKLLVWNDRFEESVNSLTEAIPMMLKVFKGSDEEYKESLIKSLTSYFIRLTAKRQYNLVKQLFHSPAIDYKQMLKPVYYAVMKYLKEEFPNEYLKAGSELGETIEEISTEIEKARSMAE